MSRAADPLAAALAYARWEWPVFPLHEAEHRSDGAWCTCGKRAGKGPGECDRAGKHPRIEHGLNEASTEADTVRNWWARWPGANIGVRTGIAPVGAGVWVLDLDLPKPGHVGLTALEYLEAAAVAAGDTSGEWRRTRTAQTGGGGLHLFYRYGPELAAWLDGMRMDGTSNRYTLRNRAKVNGVNGLDTRGDDGYIVAAPGSHASGGRYTWKNIGEVRDAPEWLLRLVARPVPAAGPYTPPPGRGETDRERAWVSTALTGICMELAATREGARNDRLNSASYRIGGYCGAGLIDAAHAENELCAAGLASGLSPGEVSDTVRRALAAGALHPIRPVLEDRRDDYRGGPMPDRDDYRDNAAPPPGDDDAPHADGPHAGDGGGDAWGRADPPPKVDAVAAMPWTWPPVEWLRNKPPNREYLLHDVPSNAAGNVPGDTRGPGMMPRGKVGILAAAGGVGKTYALCGLALAVVTGRRWLGHFPVGDKCTRRAVLILGEEDPGELQRRLHVQAQAMELGEHEQQAVTGILALPGAALDTLALTQPEEHGGRAATVFAGGLFAHLKQIADETGKGWDVVILDPLSRFSGPDVEKDNSAATRLIQVLELFTTLPGNPAVIVAHHTSQASRKEGPAELVTAAATAVRGATALTDGSRWVGTLDEVAVSAGSNLPGHARLRVVKSNYGRFPPGSLLLTRVANGGGLRAATREETCALDAAEIEAKRNEGAKEARAKQAKREGAQKVREAEED